MGDWLSFTSSRGGVLWAVLCCWVGVFANLLLLTQEVNIAYLVP